ncbi:MAG: hypothetical protein IJA78_05115 [Clostridia bacterium]|nr:hypothetical protein [Clostridia bacterium]
MERLQKEQNDDFEIIKDSILWVARNVDKYMETWILSHYCLHSEELKDAYARFLCTFAREQSEARMPKGFPKRSLIVSEQDTERYRRCVEWCVALLRAYREELVRLGICPSFSDFREGR